MSDRKIREVKRIVTGLRTVDGAGVSLVRVIGKPDTKDFDPFLMLDAFDSTNPSDYVKGFPWHPHRGIETVTYLISGDIEHGDSLGNKGSIKDGDCQWMTAGSGIIHQEMPKACERMLGVQLWVNLPAYDKMTGPKYRDINSASVPVVERNGATVRIISGSYEGVGGAVEADFVKPLFIDVEMKPNTEWSLATNPADTVFAYIVQGSSAFGPKGSDVIANRHAVLLGAGTDLMASTGQEGARFLLFAALPLNEPIAWGGQIVMNTREELSLAFREIEDDTFIKTGKKQQ